MLCMLKLSKLRQAKFSDAAYALRMMTSDDVKCSEKWRLHGLLGSSRNIALNHFRVSRGTHMCRSESYLPLCACACENLHLYSISGL
jgi:hypothetical protein